MRRTTWLVFFICLLSANANSYARDVTLQWDRSVVDGEHQQPLGYKICENYTSGVPCEVEHDAGDNDTFTVLGLAFGQEYYFRAKAWALCDGAYCESEWSNEVLSPGEINPPTNLQIKYEEIALAQTWAEVQSVENTTDSCPATFALPAFSATDGNAIIVAVVNGSNAYRVTTSITDTAGNTYTLLANYQVFSTYYYRLELWAAYNITGHSSNVVTLTNPTTGYGIRAIATEISGLATTNTQDTGYTPAGNTDGTSPYTTTPANTAENDELVFGAHAGLGGAAHVFSASSPSVLFEKIEPATGMCLATTGNHIASAGSGSVSVASTVTSNVLNLARAFKQAGGASYSIAMGAGSYSLTGSAEGLLKGSKISMAAGAYALTGSNVELLRGYKAGMEAGTYTLSGQPITFLKNSKIGIESGSYSLSGQAVDLLRGFLISMGTGSYLLTGSDISLLRGLLIAIGSGAYTWTGADVTLTYAGIKTIAMDAGSYLWTGSEVSLLKGSKISIDAGAYALTGSDVALLRGLLISTDAGSYLLTGSDISLLRGLLIAIGSGAYDWTGADVTLTYAGIKTIAMDAGSYLWAGSEVSLLRGSKISVDAGVYALTGSDVALLRGLLIVAGAGSYSLSGQDLQFLRNYLIAISTGFYALTGQAVALTWSGELIPSGMVSITFGADKPSITFSADKPSITFAVD